MFTLAFLLLCPILIFAQSKEIVAYESYDNTTNELTVLHLYKCVDDLSNELFVIFTLSCFLFAYLLPLLLMIYFYSGMILRLVHKTGIVRNSQFHKKHSGVPPLDDRIPVVQIAVYTLAICLFHIVCWTPYWASVIYSLYLELFYPPELQVPGTTFIYVMYGVHALPYINSASNFILYGLLNRQLHHSGVPPRIAAMPIVRTPSNPSSNVVSVRTDDKGRPSACVGALLSHGQSSSPQLHSDDGSDQRPILPHSNDSDDSRKSRLTVTRTNSIVGQKDSSNTVTILSNGLSTELLITSSDNNNDEVRL
ncbi:hypothetical protein AB6A40_008751 [Gnathostoma spinigerum]|uniref:G-protein coupled receptors family 1 profile domain-containing protein n=1 Tax=Gnathostoma spinigerum TaxID=75299 RepID=A0ABD6EZF5_9BILA